VHRRPLITRLLVVTSLLALPVLAAPLDKAANKKIDEAVNEHYLATNFDRAESVLLGTIKACGEKCSPNVVARAHMYIGIVRGSGKQDQAGAKQAFEAALAADATVKLDEAIATRETKATFEAASGGGGGAAPAEEPAEPSAEKPSAAAADLPGEMECTPDVPEVETRRPIPVSCTTDEDAVRVELRYREFAGEDWKTLKMVQKDDAWQAEIPCAATQNAGNLKFYVIAKDAAGDTADSHGSKKTAHEVNVVAQTDEEPPAYPGQAAPQRCAEQVECPPDFPGCKSGGAREGKGWGSSCEQSTECGEGLACVNGSCENAQTCETNADCSSGTCTNGTCSQSDTAASGPYKQNWVGLHFGLDVALVSGTDVCAVSNTDHWACYDGDARIGRDTGQGANISSGTSVATKRIMASYDRAFTPNLTLGARLGYAFDGGPGDFLPIHAEARVGYVFGSNALGRPGLRFSVHGGGGLAQVNAKVRVTVQDGTQYDAWKSMGKTFALLGGGVMYAFTANNGLQLNVSGMLLFPSSGTVIQPSLGYVMGF
jgi:hypothetical protein